MVKPAMIVGVVGSDEEPMPRARFEISTRLEGEPKPFRFRSAEHIALSRKFPRQATKQHLVNLIVAGSEFGA
jgi:hypothetical protein